MESISALIIESVDDLLRVTGDRTMQELDGRFGKIARSALEDNLTVYFHIAYHEDSDTVEYRILRDSDEGDVEPYDFVPSEYRFIQTFFIKIHRGAPYPFLKWTPTTRNDPKFLQWFNFRFYYTVLVVEEKVNFDCSSILALIPENYTFNWIIAKCKPCKAVKSIIRKSKESDRLGILDSPYC